jgi:uncharacterized protein
LKSGDTALDQKFSSLLFFLRRKGEAVLAFSGGVDSSFLLRAMHISGMRMLAVTAVSPTVPEKQVREAMRFAGETGVTHRIIETNELSNELFANNPPERCFYCKDELFRKIEVIAAEEGYGCIFDGSNADDLHDYRPGRKAASIHGVISPLAEHGFSKDEVRAMSRDLGLPTWSRPSSPCLSSRFPYGRKITIEALKRVEKAEEFLRSLGLLDLRVRDCGDTARIEVREEDMHIFFDDEKRRLVNGKLKSLGYAFVSLDLQSFKSGSLNRVLENRVPLHSASDAK